MNTTFTGYVLNPGYSIGEAVRQAKCDLVEQGRDTSPNKLQYTLLGDPALKLTCPQPDIVIDSINGQSATSAIRMQRRRLSVGSMIRSRLRIRLSMRIARERSIRVPTVCEIMSSISLLQYLRISVMTTEMV